MKIKLLFSIFFVFFGSILISFEKQPSKPSYFEGRITYKPEFENKSNKYDSSILAKVTGKISDFYYKDGNFMTNTYKAISYQNIYRIDENRLYTKKVWTDSIFWADCGKPGLKIVKFELTPKKEKILGIECDELKVFYENKIITNYFNSDTLKINPELHNNFTFYNENFYSQKMKSLSLKYIIEYSDFKLTYTAISFSYQRLLDNIFTIPKNKVLIEDD